LVIANFF